MNQPASPRLLGAGVLALLGASLLYRLWITIDNFSRIGS